MTPEEVGRQRRAPSATSPYQRVIPTVFLAIKALIDNNISVVEYGAQIQYRYGDKRYLMVCETKPSDTVSWLTKVNKNPEWVIPDDQLLFASQILLETDFPRIYPQPRPWVGYRDHQSWAHYIGKPEANLNYGIIYLVPMSLVGFTLQDTIRVKPTFDDKFHILTPKPAPYMRSLIQMLRAFQLNDVRRYRVQMDLVSFVCVGLLHTSMEGLPYYKPRDEAFKKKTLDAVKVVRAWDWGPVDPILSQIVHRIVCEPQFIWDLTVDSAMPPVPDIATV
ncbi:uncharacterized protein N7484_007436 [Penicillium longicatenatum]|uniref:uncharacterized protein n=1 Tax=Penicillium longicatenatum TaxID=1561947 RepID=UPI002546D162|nr:uncharacterized protein N7484_007436 [Penicillium longicatenatum]KAJ5639574.1 hypothetical protein N7484_007436 [Penicillium longicatenatum]